MENEMKTNRVTVGTLTINKELANGQTIAFAKIELSYKQGSLSLVGQDVAHAHVDQLFKQILYCKGVFKQQTGGHLSYSKDSGLHGDVFFCEEQSPLVDSIPDVIGDLWCNVITKGTGSYRKLPAEPLHRRPIDEVIAQAKSNSLKGAHVGTVVN
jgi:hypothetical protein